MKRTAVALCLMTLSAPAVHADGPPRLETILPAETSLLILVEDAPTLLSEWPESPLGQTWADPQVTSFLAPMRASMKIDRWEGITREATGYPLSKILESFTGQAAFVLRDFDLGSPDEHNPSFALMAHVGDKHEVIRELLAMDLKRSRKEAPEGVQVRELEEEFEAESLHVRQLLTDDEVEEGLGWAIVDGTYFMAEPKAFLQELVDAAKAGPPTGLGSSTQFQKLKRRTPASDVLLYVNLQSFVPALRASLQDEQEANPMGVTAEALIDALSLETLEAFYISGKVTRVETALDLGLLYRGDRGVTRLLAYQPGPPKLPDFFPAGTAAASVANFSIPNTWEALKEILQTMNPMLSGMLDASLQQLSATAGFDVELNLVGSLGKTVVGAQFQREPEHPGEHPSLARMDTLFGVEIGDRQSFEMALEGIKSLTGQGMELFDEREYLGETIYVSKQPLPKEIVGEPEQKLAYTFGNGYLFISLGSTAPLEAVLSGSGDRKRTIWKRKDVKAALRSIPRDVSAVSYYNVGSFVESVIDSMAQVESLGAGGAHFCDPDQKPDPRVLEEYFGIAVGSVSKNGEGIFSRFRLIHP